MASGLITPGLGPGIVVDGLGQPSGGTNHPVTLTATQATAPALGKGAAKPLALAQAQAASIRRAAGKVFAPSQATAPALARAVGKPLALSQPQQPALGKGLGKALGPLAQGALATLAALKVRLVTLAVAQATGATMQRGAGKALAAAQGQAAALGKGVAKGLAATQGSIASLTTSGGQQVVASVQTLYARAQAWVLKVRALVFGQPPSYALSPGPITQSHYETKTRTADFTAALPSGSTSVSSPVGYLIRADTGADVTGASLTVGGPSGATVPFTLTALSPGVQYRLNLVVQAAGNTITGEATVVCPD